MAHNPNTGIFVLCLRFFFFLFRFNIGFNQFIKGNLKKKNNDRLECSQRYFRDWEYCKKKRRRDSVLPRKRRAPRDYCWECTNAVGPLVSSKGGERKKQKNKIIRERCIISCCHFLFSLFLFFFLRLFVAFVVVVAVVLYDIILLFLVFLLSPSPGPSSIRSVAWRCLHFVVLSQM